MKNTEFEKNQAIFQDDAGLMRSRLSSNDPGTRKYVSHIRMRYTRLTRGMQHQKKTVLLISDLCISRFFACLRQSLEQWYPLYI